MLTDDELTIMILSTQLSAAEVTIDQLNRDIEALTHTGPEGNFLMIYI